MKLPPLLRHLIALPLDFARAVSDHDLFLNAAGSAFFLFLSIPPALLALVGLVGMIPIEEWSLTISEEFFEWMYVVLEWWVPPEAVQAYGLGLEWRLAPVVGAIGQLTPEAVVGEVSELVRSTLPPELAQSVVSLVEDIVGQPQSGLLTVGFVTIIWSASGATRSAMRALSRIYEAPPRAWWVRNSLSLMLTVGFMLVWVLSLAMLPLSEALSGLVVGYFGLDQGVQLLWSNLNTGMGIGALLVSVLFFHRTGPDVPLRLRALVPGSLLTVGLWVALSYGLGRWMERSWGNYSATYGTLAIVIVILLWCYLLCIGLLLGAELNTAVLRLRRLGLGRAGEMDVHEATRLALVGEIEPLPVVGRLAAAAGGQKQGSPPEVESGKS